MQVGNIASLANRNPTINVNINILISLKQNVVLIYCINVNIFLNGKYGFPSTHIVRYYSLEQ